MYNLTTSRRLIYINLQRLESLIQVLLSLEARDQLPSARKILKNIFYSLTQQLVQLLLKGGSFNLLNYSGSHKSEDSPMPYARFGLSWILPNLSEKGYIHQIFISQ
ncbi:hypothetical protein [Microcoleus sp. CZ3-B4]|uniref:hypothetical protein n=1 Tax=Microcoleus sp. CZ3-B4 TaxID=2818733 RepID=UPI002FD26BAF